MSTKRTHSTSNRNNKRFNGKISDKAFVDYKPEQDTRKYDVYRNDIKFRKQRNVDPSRANWNSDVEKDFHEKDTDNIEYRIEECMREKFETLDLSHMSTNCFKLLMEHKQFKIIKKKVQHVFAQSSGIRALPSLTCLESLQTLDLSNNKLRELPELPESLEELILTNNRLVSIENDLPKLKRLNVANNKIDRINFSNSLESMYLNNNPIQRLPRLSNLYYLNISTTKIQTLHQYPKLKYLDCQYTQIETVPVMQSLNYLVCNYSAVNDISALSGLESLEMIQTKIDHVHHIPSLYSLKYHADDKFRLSKRYKPYGVMKNKRDITEIIFKLSVDQLKK